MQATETCKKRAFHTFFHILEIVVAVFLYTVFFTITGKGIPCIFRLITGLKCPGCGMTHALSEILQGNIRNALSYNALSVTICPIIGFYLLYKEINYIKTGDKELGIIEILGLIVCFLVVTWYFLYRNNFI
ncbi:DUF2752 domain-containing protein [Butyrivibrio sp. YAB3001]|uniref:DUF2752 domain-containing protein n=1 Tax=Butyrivibrio sp. YAB3001 TaxID=1520812 RepID=UPI0008F63C56|nr:Protein of unknown function [Butyrivibrio sp. YAB3001]